MSQALAASFSTQQNPDALRSTTPLKARGSQRRPELDALRRLMLTLMTLAHLPTQAQVITNQQLGFVSEAEGFVFLSAFLTGRIFGRIANESGFPCDRSVTCGRCTVPAPPSAFARTVRWGTLVGPRRQMASERFAAAGLFVFCDSLCR